MRPKCDISPTSSSVKNRSIWPAAREICWTTGPSWWRRCCWWIAHKPVKRHAKHVRIGPESEVLRYFGRVFSFSPVKSRDYRPCRALPRSQRHCWRQTWPRRCTSYGRPGWSGRTLWGPGRNTHVFGSITAHLKPFTLYYLPICSPNSWLIRTKDVFPAPSSPSLPLLKYLNYLAKT